MGISYRNLPLQMYELTRYSFRLEKAGELVGLRRLRAFTMPDMHTLCSDIKTAKNEFKSQFKFSMDCLKDLGFMPGEYETAVRFTEKFWKSNKIIVNTATKGKMAQNADSQMLLLPRRHQLCSWWRCSWQEHAPMGAAQC